MRSISFRHWLLTYLLVAAILCELGFLYKDTLLWMTTSWLGYAPDRAGALVPPLFIWMAYLRIKQHPENTSEAPLWGSAVILFSLAAFVSARIIDINFVQALSLVGVALGMVTFLSGIRFAGACLFPFTFLTLMIPSISYLIEAFAGAILREIILRCSGFILHLTDSAWHVDTVGLQYGEKFLQVRFPRNGLSSALFLVILHFAVAEWSIREEVHKFLFMVPFMLYFIIAYSIYFVCAGWAVTFKVSSITSLLDSSAWWIPALFFLSQTVIVRYFIKKSVKN
jgi:hypothetical protein